MTKEMRDLDKIREDYELHLGNREFKGIVAAGIVIGLLIFALGFLVGRLFPSQPLPEREVSLPSGQTTVSEKEKMPEESQDYAFYGELAGDGPEVPVGTAETVEVTEKPAELPLAQEKVDEEKELQGVLEVTKAKPSPKKPAAPAQETRTIPSLYTIQVGAFEEAAVAEKLSNQLHQKGYPAYTMVKSIPGKGVWHRVRVGQYAHRTEAEGVVVQLEQREHLSGFITLYAKSTQAE